MRIENIHIDGFGHFSDSQVGPLDAPITVFFGPNEAGKTTLLAFVRAILFGFPARLRAKHYPPLRGGNHGGHLFLIDEDGLRYTVGRTETPSGVALQVVTSDGRDSADEAFLAGVLGHASKEMFESVFAFSLTELQQLESLDKGDVSAQIYSAGMGAAALPAAMGSLKSRQEALFLPGGSKQAVAETLTELEKVDLKLQIASDASARYAELVARQGLVRDELETGQAMLRDLNGRRQRLVNLRQAWDDWVLRDSLVRRTQELPEFADFPSEAIGRLEKLEERVKATRLELLESQGQLEVATAAVQTTAGDTRVLEYAAEIGHLHSSRDRFAASVADAPKREVELADLRREFEDGLRTLGPGWDRERLEQFDISSSQRAAIDDWAADLEDAARVLRSREDEAARSEDAREDMAEKLTEQEADLESRGAPPFSSEQLAERREYLRRCRTVREDWLRNQTRQEDLQAQVDAQPGSPAEGFERPWSPLAVLAICGTVIAAIGLGLGGAAAFLGLVIGAGLLVATGILWSIRQKASSTAGVAPGPGLKTVLAQLENSSAVAQKLEAELVETASLLHNGPIDPQALVEFLDQMEADLAQATAKLSELTSVQRGIAEDRKAGERLENRVGAAVEAAGQAREQLDRKQREWREWLGVRHLAENLLPHTVGVVFGQVENARQRARAVAAMRVRLEGIQSDIDQYAKPVVQLAGELDLEIEATNPASVVSAASQLIILLEAARKTEAAQIAALEKLEQARGQQEARERDALPARNELEELLVLGGAANAEEFREHAAVHAERTDTERGIRGSEERLRRLSGPGDALNRLSADLEGTDLATLEADLVHLDVEIKEADEKRTEAIREQAKLEKEISDLTSEEETSELRAHRETLKANLDATARQWSVLTVARGLMAEAQRKYEQERQPAVIRHADRFFQTVTAGRYRDLISPLGSQKLTVSDSDGTRKEPEQLSKGTQEALYLALRFGLIRQFGEQATSLPVIVDEILVNFDPDRAQRAAEGFAELSKTNQILVFTCHPAIRDLFTAASSDTQVIEIDANR